MLRFFLALLSTWVSWQLNHDNHACVIIRRWRPLLSLDIFHISLYVEAMFSFCFFNVFKWHFLSKYRMIRSYIKINKTKRFEETQRVNSVAFGWLTLPNKMGQLWNRMKRKEEKEENGKQTWRKQWILTCRITFPPSQKTKHLTSQDYWNKQASHNSVKVITMALWMTSSCERIPQGRLNHRKLYWWVGPEWT